MTSHEWRKRAAKAAPVMEPLFCPYCRFTTPAWAWMKPHIAAHLTTPKRVPA